MATQLGLSRTQVHFDLVRLRNAALDRAAINKAAETARLLLANDRATAMAVDSYERSLVPQETTTTEQRTDPDGGVTTIVKITRHCLPGDAAVANYLRAQAQRAQLLGLNAPTKTEVAGPGGGPVAVRAELAPEDVLARYRDAFAVVLAAQANGHGRAD
jgi:hypothetical protein